MQKLLSTSLSDFQAMILFWTRIGVRNIKVSLDISSFDFAGDVEVTLDTIGLALCDDDNWLSYFRHDERDEDDFEYIVDGETILSGERNPQTLVYRTLSALATFGLDMAFEYENERLEDEVEIYKECERHLRPAGYFCWKCRHNRFPNQHAASCCLCQSIGRTAEENTEDIIPFRDKTLFFGNLFRPPTIIRIARSSGGLFSVEIISKTILFPRLL